MSTNTFFDDLNEIASSGFVYTAMTEAQLNSSVVGDVIEWAEGISGEWNGDEPGSLEDRANCANEIIEKLNEAKQLIAEMENL